MNDIFLLNPLQRAFPYNEATFIYIFTSTIKSYNTTISKVERPLTKLWCPVVWLEQQVKFAKIHWKS
jgi:hypothetical protein